MALFVVHHKHSSKTCPAASKEMGSFLLSHLSPENAEKNGIRIESEAVIDGQHTLYLIVDAESEDVVTKFMTPFTQAGSVEVMPASLCETVVSRGAC